MRILTVNVHYAPQSFGGATIVAEQTSQALRERGHDVIVLTGSTDKHLAEGRFHRYDVDGLPVVAMGRSHPSSVEAEYHRPALAANFQQVLEATRPDVVHFHAIQALGVEMVSQAQAAGVPTVVTLHDAWWLCERQFMVRADGSWCGQSAISPAVCSGCVPDPQAHRRRQEQSLQILNACSQVLTPSQYWYDLMSASGVSTSVLKVNRNGVSHPRQGFVRSEHRGPVRFAYVGGDNRVKGAPQLREALAGITRSDYQLQLVDASLKLGHPSLFARDWQYSGQILVVPGYDIADIDEFFDGVDVLLFPSQWHESYGLTVREAVLRGVWVVGTAGGGASEDLVDGVNSTLIPLDGTGTGLRRALTSILDDPAAFTNRAEPVRQIPTFAEQAQELEAIYTHAINR